VTEVEGEPVSLFGGSVAEVEAAVGDELGRLYVPIVAPSTAKLMISTSMSHTGNRSSSIKAGRQAAGSLAGLAVGCRAGMRQVANRAISAMMANSDRDERSPVDAGVGVPGQPAR
jgi:hypothetical protein